MSLLPAAAALLLLAAEPGAPAPKDPRPATFALVVGVNKSREPGKPDLRYADDDAVRYHELFHTLGARAYLLTRTDANTTRLHPQAAAEAAPPTRLELDAAVAQLAADVLRARAGGLGSVLYVVYAGHGVVRSGRTLLSMEDDLLSAEDLSVLLRRIDADVSHLVVDACYSYLLAYGRGPGGERREAQGFTATPEIAADGRVGMLLSSSVASESHEWEGVQAGVFSHEVRSGMLGAADADADGMISYREIAAFVDRANAAIPNERFRPRVYARPPRITPIFADIRPGLTQSLEVDMTEGDHFILENADGVRLSEFHNADGQFLRLARPANARRLYLRSASKDAEFLLPAGGGVVKLSELQPEPQRVEGRGAAHESFSLLFSLPFDRRVVEGWIPPTEIVGTARSAPSARSSAGWLSVGVGGAALIGGGVFGLQALRMRDQGAASHLEVTSQNAQLKTLNRLSTVLFVASAAAGAGGVALLLWPQEQRVRGEPGSALSLGPGGAGIAGVF